MNTTKQTVPTEQKFYNPLIVSLETLEVKDKTVENYFTQIKNNLYVGIKSHYLVSRDFYDAKQTLKTPEFQRLCEQLGFSGSTQQKYLSIGADIRLMRVFTAGKLPMKWTTQYLLTKLSDEQFSTVERNLDPETTASEISQIAGLKKEQKEEIANDLLKLFELELVKTEIDSISNFEKIVEKVKSALSKIPQVKINDEKVDSVKQRLTAYISKLEKDKEKQEAKKLKKLKDNNDKKLSQTIFDKSKQIGKLATD